MVLMYAQFDGALPHCSPAQLVAVATFSEEYVSNLQAESSDFLRGRSSSLDLIEIHIPILNICYTHVGDLNSLTAAELPTYGDTRHDFGDIAQSALRPAHAVVDNIAE